LEGFVLLEVLTEGIHRVFRDGHLGVDSFVGQVDSAKTTEGLPFTVELIAEMGRVRNVDVSIEREGDPVKGFLHQLFAKELAVYRIVQNGHGRDGKVGLGWVIQDSNL
jgi:hypothetical protein